MYFVKRTHLLFVIIFGCNLCNSDQSKEFESAIEEKHKKPNIGAKDLDTQDYQSDYGYGGGGYGNSGYGALSYGGKGTFDDFHKNKKYKVSEHSYGIKPPSYASSSSSSSSSYGGDTQPNVFFEVPAETHYKTGSEHNNPDPYEFKSFFSEKHYGNDGKSSGDHTRKVCTNRPKPILNASLKCSLVTNSCKAKCIDNYQFPNGETTLKVSCEAGEWTLEQLEWSDKLACEPICMPPCKNNGICIQPGTCYCAENFVGPYCEHEKKLCITWPVKPQNSELSCKSMSCTVACAKGHTFPDGSSITNLICKDGEWVPSRPEQTLIPDCQPTCTPPCQNAGTCLSYNVCQCPKTFRGKQCQYNVDVCSPKKMNFNGAYSCSGDNDSFRCKLTCPVGIEFTEKSAPEYICEYEKGYFSPEIIPQCNYSADIQIIPGDESSHSYSMLNRTMTMTSGSGGVKRLKKIRKKGYHKYDVEDGDDEDVSYEKIITKTKILIKKGRKSKKGKGGYESGEDYEEYENGEDNESSHELRVTGVYSLYMSGNVTIKHRVPKPATCVSWNGNKMKTFDGLVYNHNFYCSHSLVQDNIDGTFGVVLRACPRSAKQPCAHAIEIMLATEKYTIENLNGTVTLSTKSKHLPIPTQLLGLRITKIGHNYKIHMELIGLTMFWDSERIITVEATAGLFNRTAGLCGTLDQNIGNDFMSKDGTVHKLTSTFVDAWQVPDSNNINDICSNDSPNDQEMELVCSDEIKSSADRVCKKLLGNSKFKECLKTLKIEAMMETCVSDYCYCSSANREQCACNGISVFAKECLFQGIMLNENWRDMETCPLPCESGRVYKACGPSFEQSCGSAIEDAMGTITCNEGCFCPEGTVQHHSKCIRIDECPCSLRGKVFKSGAEILKDCNTCKCEKGVWKCSDATCGARCGAIGDPHYLTFDGKHFDFMGKCSYYLLKKEDFSIEAENIACPGSISESMNFAPSGVDMPSCTKSVTIKMMHENRTKSIKLKQGRQIQIDGLEITKLPLKIYDGLLRIRFASSTMLLVAFHDGLKLWWDGMTRVYIDAPASYRGKTQGLCGTFNQNQQDDFLTPEGDIESSIASFANKWRTKESCDFVNDNVNIPHPCQANMENKERALSVCAKLKGNIFEDCHWSVDLEPYYEDCMYDMCACKGDAASCMCPIFAAYSNECAQQGSIIDWRQSIKECAIKCPAGQIYEECADKCYRSCADIDSTKPCKTKCVEGCRCANGQALSDDNECIPIGLCPCSYKGLTFNSGYKEVRPGTKHLDLCTCSGAVWNCVEATDSDKDKYPPASDIRSRCLVDNNEEFTTCEPIEPKTCKNMDSYIPSTTADCRPGCVCKNGYVLDVALKKCVLPGDCSCHHGSKSYSEGEKIKSDCNTCVCKGGNWNCTDRSCPATCTVWGDSHFQTYDGKDFDFQGACNYVLSKGAVNSGEGFSITIQNVMCGSQGVTCSKSVTIALLGKETESITLNSDSAVPGSLLSKKDSEEIVHSGVSKKMTIHRAGIFVVIEVPGIGVQLKWDRGTRFYVQLTSRWKGRVQGLCGNYDGNALNDLKSPSSGLETNAMLFGNSWKLEDFCPQPSELIDACNVHPERKIWAEKKCGILKSTVFAKCHSEVDVDRFLKRCEFDTCACDQGGDCECLCTSIAAYAHACTMKGVPIRWRTPDLCPMQCDPHCSEYKSCISACPIETCENSLDQGKNQKLCIEDTCVEGCQLKPCPEGEIYSNNSYTECVPKAVCKPVCLTINEIVFYEGDATKSDNCQTCHCSKGKEVCIGVPCTPTSILPGHGTPSMNQDAADSCKSGWTDWINQDKLIDGNKSKENLKVGDIEPLPNPFELKNFKNSAFCLAALIKQIECRTVYTRMHPKQLGEDVECSLEKGLICDGPCHDYEIRVLCDCDDNIEIFTIPTVDHHHTTLSLEQPIWSKIIQSTTEALILAPVSICDPAIPHVEKPGDCHQFYHCQMNTSGVWMFVEKSCGPDMMFNPQWMICDHIASVMLIKPSCGETSVIPPKTITYVEEKVVSKCPMGKVWSDCAVPCNRACHFYGKYLQKSGLCTGNYNGCVKGCVLETATVDCPTGQFWRDDKVCVKVGDCTCQSDDGNVVKPGSIYKESDCKICQCIDNVYVCDAESCKVHIEEKKIENASTTTNLVKDNIVTVVREPSQTTVVVNTVTPPLNCEPERLMPLVNGQNPIPDSAFNASSYLSSSFKPHFSRLSSKSTSESSGSWSPEINDQMQYLQIGFDKPIPLFGIIIQGSPIFDQYVTSFKILHSSEGIAFHYLVDETTHPQIFSGPIDSRTPVKSVFKIPIEAKVIRIYPLTWHGSIAIRAELLGCSPSKVNITISPHHEQIAETPMCDDPLGVKNGKLHPEQIQLSSFRANIPEVQAKESLKLSSPSGWRPNIDSPNEYVVFDFLQLRNVTSVETKGGDNGWVTAYNVLYTQDFTVWNTLLNAEGTSAQLFLGNFDSVTPKVNHFRFPVQARALKIIPIKWHNCIEMKIEPIGCFVPYDQPDEIHTSETKSTEVPILATECNICPGVFTSPSMIEGTCRCQSPLLWNGNECVTQNTCPCVVGHLTYGIGAQFEKDDCSKCICVLGGVVQCKPQECAPCGNGLRRIETVSCLCQCEPCPNNQVLCQTSGACIPESAWCDGIQDCPDDEISCSYKQQSQTTTVKKVKEKIIITKTCPEPKCPPGFYVKLGVVKTGKSSPMLQSSQPTPISPGIKNVYKDKIGNDIDKYQSTLPQPDEFKNEIENCIEYDCIPEKPKKINVLQTEKIVCPAPSCPSSYDVVLDVNQPTQACAKYKCEPLPQNDVVCNVTSRTFNTFDGTEFKYDICDHILARDLVSNNWTISLQKNCSIGNFVCKKQILITDKSCNLVIVLYTDLTLNLDEYHFTVEQLQKSVYSQMNLFVVSKVGNSILFVSHAQGYWVRLDDTGDIKIGVSGKHKLFVDGLCGFYNENAADDKRLPNGAIVLSSVDFGDGWFRDAESKKHCEPHACSQTIQDIAWQICNTIKDETFASCSKSVNADKFISRCLETACDCLNTASSGGSNELVSKTKNKCKCSILQNYVTECMASDENIHLDTWRTKFECLTECAPTLVHRDCYRRRCEPSCEMLNQQHCPHLPGTCFSGCYCPEGSVRKGDKCVPVSECKDCICDGFGRSQYITYDRKNFTFDGNCTYLLSRDLLIPNGHTFQVYTTLAPCYDLSAKGKPIAQQSCTQSLHILYGEHIVHLQRNTVSTNSINTLIDGIEAKKLPFNAEWITVTEDQGKGININLKKSQLELTAMFDDLAFSIKTTSIKYGSKIEGLCGDCNGNPNDDLKPNPKYADQLKPNDSLNKILETWSANEPALKLKEKCVSEAKIAEDCIPLPPESDPCLVILDRSVFGQCHLVTDPLKYVSLCQIDMCKTGPVQKGACAHLAAYARECSRNGICVDWKKGICSDKPDCPSDMEYNACGCKKTCETIKVKKDALIMSTECLEPGEGCFCRDEGKVLNNGKCIPAKECTPCDDQKHFAGDTWQPDKCSVCECSPSGNVNCTRKQCATEGVVCQLGFKQIVIDSNADECCKSYKCIPETTKSAKCADTSMPQCAPDQFNKMVTDDNNCTKYVCECKPLDQCDKNLPPRLIRAGEKLINDTSGCCPKSKIICDKSKCPAKPTNCAEELYDIVRKDNVAMDLCCDEFVCMPPKNLCIIAGKNNKKVVKNIGEVWSTDTPCMHKKCTYGADGTLVVIDERQTCPVNDCGLGFKLVIENGQCCGVCAQEKCVVDGIANDAESIWYSKDNCTTFKCALFGKQLVVSSSQPTCPDVSGCPKELKYFEDCCERCKQKTEDKKTCLPLSLGDSETIGLVEKIIEPHGKCTNTQPIRGFTECHGACNSGTKYNRFTLKQDQKCQCCSIGNYDEIKVPLKCYDGTKETIAISVPRSCTCQLCEKEEKPQQNAASAYEFLKSTVIY